MAFSGGTPPGPHAGNISPETISLRPQVDLDQGAAAEARRLRRAGWTIGQIAEQLEADQASVMHALATLRTRKRAPPAVR